MKKNMLFILLFITSELNVFSQTWTYNKLLPDSNTDAKVPKLLKNCVYIPSQKVQVNSFEGFDSLSFYLPKNRKVDGFYISKYEVSNAEYKEFIQYVKDSIARELVGYIKQDIYGHYRVDFKRKVDFESPNTKEKLDAMFLSPDKRIFGRKEYDVSKFCYALTIGDSIFSVPIYPDTLCWMHNIYGSTELAIHYLKDNRFSNYPVVGINYWQSLAYCDWKTRKINAAAEDIYFINLPTAAEWETAAGSDIYKNSNINKYPFLKSEMPGLRELTPAYNCFSISDEYGFTIRQAGFDGFYYTAPVDSYKPEISGVYNIRGNVAEWTLDTAMVLFNSEINKRAKFLQEMIQRNDTFNIQQENTFLKLYRPSDVFFRLSADTLGLKGSMIVKGGSWNDSPFYLQRGVNQFYRPETQSSTIGFRYVVHRMKQEKIP
ncbi:MAG: SUMF1/EgtB/PvdO family nonheme iron enzyme [Ferruginibacter sp.]